MWVTRMLVGGVVLCAGLLGCVPGEGPEAALPEAEEISPTAGLPQVAVPKPHERPLVDGSLDDAAWRYAPVLKTAFIWGGEELPKQKTEIKLLAGKKALYVAFICFESHMREIVADKTERDSEVWQDDVVELFLSPGEASSEDYYHVLVNARGTVADERYRDATAWDAKGLKSAVKRRDDRWVVELALPWSDVSGGKEALPAKWRANFTRSRPQKGYTDSEDQAWSPTLVNTSHVPERFGFLVIDAFKTAE